MPTRAQRAQSAAAAKVASPDPAAEADTGSPLSEAHTESHDGEAAAEAVEEPVENEAAQEEVNEAVADEEMIKEDVKSDEGAGTGRDDDAPVDELKEDEAPTEDVSMNAAETTEKTTIPNADAQGPAEADAPGDAEEENVSPGAHPAQDGEDDDELMLNNQEEKPTVESEEAADDTPAPPAPRTTAPDRTLMDFLKILDTHAPIIPDAVTDYYLSQAGFECDDPRIKRLLALAAQKFVADIAQDAYQHSKIRSSGTGGGGAGAGTAAGLPGVPAAPKGSSRFGKDRGRAVLTMDDLGAAVQEYGIHIKRQDFMR